MWRAPFAGLIGFVAALTFTGCTMIAPRDVQRPAPRGPDLATLLSCLRDSGTTLAVAAHGQATPQSPENTLTGMTEALGNGALALQVDVRQTADGDLILMQDATLDRTTTLTGRVAEHDFAAIRQARVRAARGTLVLEPPPTLDEALLLAKRRGVVLFIAPRGGVPPAAIVQAIEDNDMADRVVVLPERAEDAGTYAALAPGILQAIPVSSADAPSSARYLTFAPTGDRSNAGLMAEVRTPPDAASLAGRRVAFYLTPYARALTDRLTEAGAEGGECYSAALTSPREAPPRQ